MATNTNHGTITREQANDASKALLARIKSNGGPLRMDFDAASPIDVWVLGRADSARGQETRPAGISLCPNLAWVKERAITVGFSNGGFTVAFYGRGCGAWFPLGNLFLAE